MTMKHDNNSFPFSRVTHSIIITFCVKWVLPKIISPLFNKFEPKSYAGWSDEYIIEDLATWTRDGNLKNQRLRENGCSVSSIGPHVIARPWFSWPWSDQVEYSVTNVHLPPKWRFWSYDFIAFVLESFIYIIVLSSPAPIRVWIAVDLKITSHFLIAHSNQLKILWLFHSVAREVSVVNRTYGIGYRIKIANTSRDMTVAIDFLASTIA